MLIAIFAVCFLAGLACVGWSAAVMRRSHGVAPDGHHLTGRSAQMGGMLIFFAGLALVTVAFYVLYKQPGHLMLIH